MMRVAGAPRQSWGLWPRRGPAVAVPRGAGALPGTPTVPDPAPAYV